MLRTLAENSRSVAFHAKKQRVHALVFVGDAMEEKLDELCGLAGQLGLRGVPAFVFHEGNDATAARAFKDIARLSHGAYCRFDASSADELTQVSAFIE